jgi:hypothetical protein
MAFVTGWGLGVLSVAKGRAGFARFSSQRHFEAKVFPFWCKMEFLCTKEDRFYGL